ncbi:MAG: Rho termination factor N-terminal domain-containing protein [Solirubrobacteraceae bacterium]
MSVLDRSALEASPLADLHAIGSELGIDGFRRLRREALIDAILERQGLGGAAPSEPGAEVAATSREAEGEAESGEAPPEPAPEVAATSVETEGEAESGAEAETPARRRRRRGGRRRRGDGDDGDDRERGEQRGREAGVREEGVPEESVGEEGVRQESVSAAGGGEAGGREADGREAGGPEADVRDQGGREAAVAEASPADEEREEAQVVEGTVELLGGGSGFVRVSPPEPSDDDVYISAAQVRRCELVSGDVIAGPVRPPRRSERYPSLVRVDTINGTPADEVTAGTRYEDMPSAFPIERLALGGDDPTVRAIEWLTPFGKGSRVAITGPARAGKTEALRRIAVALAAQAGGGVEGSRAASGEGTEDSDVVSSAGAESSAASGEGTEDSDAVWGEGAESSPAASGAGVEAGDGGSGLEVHLVLAGVRPEEVADWEDGPVAPSAATALGASPDSQGQAIDRVVEQARRVAARGRDAVVLVDGLDGLHPPAARKVLASARNLVEAGSLTIVATATAPVGGETTVIALNRTLTSTGRFPALDLAGSGTVRAELLVGEAGAAAIAKARLEALEG